MKNLLKIFTITLVIFNLSILKSANTGSDAKVSDVKTFISQLSEHDKKIVLQAIQKIIDTLKQTGNSLKTLFDSLENKKAFENLNKNTFESFGKELNRFITQIMAVNQELTSKATDIKNKEESQQSIKNQSIKKEVVK